MTESDREWISTKLGAACAINPRKPNLEGLPDDTPVLFVPMASVDEVKGEITRPEQRRLGDVRTKSYTTFAPGDVLFAKITPCMENGKSAVVPAIDSGLGFGSTEFHVLRPATGIDPRYIWHLVRQVSFRRDAEAHMSGSVGQARVPAAFLDNFPIFLPPESLRRDVAELLDATAEAHANAAGHLASAKRALDRFRQAVLAAACSGGLTEDWRDEHPAEGAGVIARVTARPVNEHTQLDVPESWCVVAMDTVLSSMKYGTSQRADYSRTGTPVLRIPNVSSGRLDLTDLKRAALSDKEREQLALTVGDLLMVRSNGSPTLLGITVAVTEMAVGMAYAGYLIRLRLDQSLMDPAFLELVLASHPLRRQIEMPARSTSGVHNINTSEIARLGIPLPPIEEQHEIVRRARQLMQHGEALDRRLSTSSQLVELAANALLTRVFSRSAPNTNAAKQT